MTQPQLCHLGSNDELDFIGVLPLSPLDSWRNPMRFGVGLLWEKANFGSGGLFLCPANFFWFVQAPRVSIGPMVHCEGSLYCVGGFV